MPRVAAKRIVISRANFARQVFDAAIACGLASEPALLLTAHAAISCAWATNLWNWNIHGHKGAAGGACPSLAERPKDDWPIDGSSTGQAAGTDWGHAFTCLLTKEWVSGVLTPTRAPFRAFDGPADALAASIALLRQPAYQRAWKALEAGSVDYFYFLGATPDGDGWSTTPAAEVRADGVRALAEVRALIAVPVVAATDVGVLLVLLGLFAALLK